MKINKVIEERKTMSEKEAIDKLYTMWENGEVPSNFTEEHSEHYRAVEQLVELGYLIHSDFF